MSAERSVIAFVLLFCGAACVLPWADKPASAVEGETDASTPDEVNSVDKPKISAEQRTLCEELAPAGCITACKALEDCVPATSKVINILCEDGQLLVGTKDAYEVCGPAVKADSVADAAIGAARKRVFVTRDAWNADLRSAGLGADGLAGADNLCQRVATGAGISGVWMARLPTSTGDATSRFNEAVGGWYDVKRGSLLFRSRASLNETLMLRAGFGVTDENGDNPLHEVWLGTSGALTNTCNDWTSASSALKVSRMPNGLFDVMSDRGCDTQASLLCVEQ